MTHTKIYNTPIGKIGFTEDGLAITSVAFIPEEVDIDTSIEETTLLADAYNQLMEYLNGDRKDFSLPLNPAGTPFQKKVWEVLRSIPYGETLSYKEVAEKAGNSKASRAVGMANNRNPIPVIIPCHRVIGADGKLVGYGGGLPTKIKLLTLENCKFINA
ncbi:MAG: ogt [Anaerocolumna sp.]|jgi:methylated-DNA-[protein]-cysteine S-methyltransferase|nr:ogt [Anaerocolumna sp.]